MKIKIVFVALLFCGLVRADIYKDIQTTSQTIGIVTGSILIIRTASDLYDYMNPSEAQIAAKKAEHDKNVKQLAYLQAFRSMNQCLVDNAKEPRDSQGIPVNCQSVCQLFAQVAGYEVLKREIDAFVTYTK